MRRLTLASANLKFDFFYFEFLDRKFCGFVMKGVRLRCRQKGLIEVVVAFFLGGGGGTGAQLDTILNGKIENLTLHL